MKKILLLEDDESLGSGLQKKLSEEYQVTWCRSVEKALKALDQDRFHLAILDVTLPDGSGFDVLKVCKSKFGLKAILLTAKSDPNSRLQGYELGAEEYISKPFHLKELFLRIGHVFETHVEEEILDLGDRKINLSDLSISHGNGEIDYPPVKDMLLLKLLVESAPHPVSRDTMIDRVWGQDREISPRTIDNSIARIRGRLGKDEEKYIRSVRGIGYQWSLNE